MSENDNARRLGHATVADGATADGSVAGDAGTTDPDALRAEIDKTRSDLSQDVNALGEAVSPAGIVKRQTSKASAKVTSALSRAKGHITGVERHDHDESSACPGSGEGRPGMGTRALELASVAKRQARRNPMVVGIIALGAGWIFGRFIPSRRRGDAGRRS
jgi:hypothetical protein